MDSSIGVTNVRYLSLVIYSNKSTLSDLSLSILSFNVFLNLSIFLAVLLSASDNATFNPPSRKFRSYDNSLSSFLTDVNAQSYISINNPVNISTSSLFSGSNLVILSTEFFYSMNSSILITIPDNDLILLCNHNFNDAALFLNVDMNISSILTRLFYDLLMSIFCILSILILNNPISIYGTNYVFIIDSTAYPLFRHNWNILD